MTAPLTIFEHETREFAWTDRDLAALERLRGALGVEALRPSVRRGARAVQAGQYVGVVRLGHRTIQILPKIYRDSAADNEQERVRDATRNLLHLLAYAGELPIREHAVASLLHQDSDWFEILTRLFAAHLLEEWQRGAYRTYQSVDGDLPLLKGKWRVAVQLRRPERQHVFSVTYDEFSADNPLNRVFRFVVERLWHLTRDADNRQRLGELRQWLEDVTLLPPLTAADARAITLTRLNGRYAPLLNLARLFLDDSALQLAAGDLSTFAFVFDMNRLFESFVVNFIRRHRAAILPAALRSCELLPQSRGAQFHLARSDSRLVFRLEPDLAFRDGDRFPLLLDAKYKRLNPTDAALGVSQDDFYQMHAYAHRYDCPRVVLIYPQTAEMPESVSKQFVLGSEHKAVVVATVDLQARLGASHDRQHLLWRLRAVLDEERSYGYSDGELAG